MRKLITLLLVGMFFVPCAMAASTVSVRVSFTIPERIEICDNSQAQSQSNMDAAPAEEQTAITTTVQNKIVSPNGTYLMQTVLPK